MGAAKVSAYVTHGVFPNRSWERFKHDNGGEDENSTSFLYSFNYHQAESNWKLIFGTSESNLVQVTGLCPAGYKLLGCSS